MQLAGQSCGRAGSALIVAIILAAGMLAGCSKNQAKPPAREAIPVTVAVAVQKNVPVQVRAIGNVEAYSTVSIKTQVTGELTGVYFKEGQDVRKGQLLFTLDKRPFEAALRQAEGQLARDAAQAANAKAQAARYAALMKEGVISREANEQTQTSAEALDAAVAADRAAVENARVQLQYCSIYAPIDGRTGNLLVHQGNMVKANDTPPLVVINKIQPIYVTFSIPEQSLAQVKQSMARRPLSVEAAVPDYPKSVGGKLVFIDNAVDPQTGMIKLKAEFANSERHLWPGQFSNVTLTLATEPNAIVVPAAAVQTGQNGQFVFVIKSDNTAEMRNVNVSRNIDGQAVIRTGLNAGERVVTDGQLRLMPGAKVAISNSNGAAAPAPTATAEQNATQQGTGS